MINENLAPVYLDNKQVQMKDPKPKVSAILSAGGKPDAVSVKWLTSQADTQGKSLRADEFIDRTSEPTKAIYLTSDVRGQGASFAGKGSPAPVPGVGRKHEGSDASKQTPNQLGAGKHAAPREDDDAETAGRGDDEAEPTKRGDDDAEPAKPDDADEEGDADEDADEPVRRT